MSARNKMMDYVINSMTASSYIDDDSANVVIVDQNSYALSELNDKLRKINLTSSMEDDGDVLFLFTPETLINATPLMNISTVKYEVGYRDPLSIIVPVSVCYMIIFIAGVLGNFITCIVIAKNKTMHTATNYYLFNLAVSDFLVLMFGEFFLLLL